MFDARIRPIIDPPLNAVAKVFAKFRVGANAITLSGFGLGMMACVAIVLQEYTAALILIVLNRVADGLDGAVARRTGSTDVGGYLDIVLDMIFYSGVPFAFAVSRPEFALPASFLIYSFVGTGGSFLAYATIAAKRGLRTESRGKKAFYYAAGLMEGTETIVFFILFCLFPEHFPVLAWVFGGLCWLTTTARIIAGVIAFREPHSGSSL